MMRVLEMVYCVACSNLVSRANAQRVFRTGFYKVTTPLALCTACANEQAQPADFAEERGGAGIPSLPA